MTPQNWVRTCGEVRTKCDGREVGQLEPHPGGLSLKRGQGQSLVINTPILNTTSNNLPQGGAGARPFLLHPSPLEDQPLAARCYDGPLICPRMMPLCLRPHGQFPSPPPYTFHDPNAPHLQ